MTTRSNAVAVMAVRDAPAGGSAVLAVVLALLLLLSGPDAAAGASDLSCPKGYIPGCTRCTGATFQPMANQTTCLPCAAPNIPKSANTICTAGPGYQPGPSGIYGQPEMCPAGKFKPVAGSQPCHTCSGATYAPNPGSTACNQCDTPNRVNTNRTMCVSGPGFQPGSDGAPEPCPAGTVKRKLASIPCAQCPTGKVANYNRTICIPPPPLDADVYGDSEVTLGDYLNLVGITSAPYDGNFTTTCTATNAAGVKSSAVDFTDATNSQAQEFHIQLPGGGGTSGTTGTVMVVCVLVPSDTSQYTSGTGNFTYTVTPPP